MTLFTHQSAKISAGEGMGIEGLILYLTPAALDGVNNCPWSTAGCRKVCLGETSGRMVMSNAREARARRTRTMRHDPQAFWTSIREEVGSLIRRAARKGAVAAVRMDGTSDLGLAQGLCREYPGVIWYDYTKSYRRMVEWLDTRDSTSNRWLTFSRSEANDAECLDVLRRGGNVAVVFSTRKGESLPAEWQGHTVIDGDAHDWRWLDASHGPGVVVGLRAKGAAKRDTSGFVVNV